MSVPDLFPHVEVHVPVLHFHAAGPVLFIQESGQTVQEGFPFLKMLFVMVPDQHVDFAGLHIPGDLVYMEESFVPFGIFRLFPGRQGLLPFHGQGQGILHLPFGGAGVDAAAVEGDHRIVRVEVLIFQSSQFTPVHGIGKVRPEFCHIEGRGAPAGFLIRGKAHPESPVGNFRMVPEIFQSRHNGRHPGFVVRPQKGSTVGEQDILAPVLFDLREIFRGKQDLFVPVQQDVFSVIVPDQEGLHVLAGSFRTGVHMGDESHGGTGDPCCGRQGAHYIPLVIQGHIRKPQAFQFFRQESGQHHLARCAGQFPIILLAGLGIERNVFQEPVDDGLRINHGIIPFRFLGG